MKVVWTDPPTTGSSDKTKTSGIAGRRCRQEVRSAISVICWKGRAFSVTSGGENPGVVLRLWQEADNESEREGGLAVGPQPRIIANGGPPAKSFRFTLTILPLSLSLSIRKGEAPNSLCADLKRRTEPH